MFILMNTYDYNPANILLFQILKKHVEVIFPLFYWRLRKNPRQGQSVGKIPKKIKELGCVISSSQSRKYQNTQQRNQSNHRPAVKKIKFYTKTPKIVEKFKQFSKKCKQFLNKSKTLSPYGTKKELFIVVVVSFAEQQSTNH